jgi:hypothetical protein
MGAKMTRKTSGSFIKKDKTLPTCKTEKRFSNFCATFFILNLCKTVAAQGKK